MTVHGQNTMAALLPDLDGREVSMCLCGEVFRAGRRDSADELLFGHLREARLAGDEMATGTYAMCPVLGCSWSMEFTRADQAMALLGARQFPGIDAMVSAATSAAGRRDDERALRHVEERHTVVELLQTIARLRGEVERLRLVSGSTGVGGSSAGSS